MTIHSIQQRIFYYLYLLRFISIHDIDDNSKMICTEDRMKRILYVSRQKMKHILYVWNHEDMSWNLFIAEYLKLNRKKTAWMTRIVSLLERHKSTVSLLQRRVLYWSFNRARHSIVSLLERHSKSNSVTNLSLFASSMIYLYSRHWRQQQDNMYWEQNETYTICLKTEDETYTICLKSRRYELKLVHRWIFEAE